MTRSFVVATALFATATLASMIGCEDEEKVLVGEGGVCASILDCQPGLSCVASGSERVCKAASTNVPVSPNEDAGTDAADDAATETDAETDAEIDAEPEDAGDSAPPRDASDAAIGDASDAG